MEIKNCGNRIVAGEGKILRRKADGAIVGYEYWIGYIYFKNNVKLENPILETPDSYEEINIPEEYKEVTNG